MAPFLGSFPLPILELLGRHALPGMANNLHLMNRYREGGLNSEHA
jgi:hypothetical protein